MTRKNVLETIIAIGVIIGMLMGAVSYFATARDLHLTQMRLEEKIQSDNVMNIKKEIWQLEERNSNRPCGEWKSLRDREEYKRLLFELEEAQQIRRKLKEN